MKNKILITIGISIILLVGFLFFINAGDETEILRPNGIGDVTELTPIPAVDNYLNVDESSADDYTTVNGYRSTSFEKYDLYKMENSSNNGEINSVTIYNKFYGAAGGAGSGGSRCATKIKTGGTEFKGSEVQGNWGWQTINTVYSENPDTNSSWTWEEINNLQIGAYLEGGGESPVSGNVTQVYVEVDYKASSTPKTLSLYGNNKLSALGNGRLSFYN